MSKVGPYPFGDTFDRLRLSMESKTPLDRIGSREDYLDLSERIVRTLVKHQAPDGTVLDPYHSREPNLEFFATSRLAGALGQLVKAGRCHDLKDALIKAVDRCLPHLNEPKLAPEFWVKELVYAWEALERDLSDRKREEWRKLWLAHDPNRSYRCIVEGEHHNLRTFVALGEYLKHRNDLGGDLKLVDGIIADQLDRRLFTPTGLYVDPGAPMTYALVVNQQWDALLHWGYDGPRAAEMRELSERSGKTWLLIQSVTGEGPFGGRSNQFNFFEGHLACFFETQANRRAKAGDMLLALSCKRSARMALASIKPWVTDIEPFRHLKHGFDPKIEHGVDSGGTYSVYGALAASLLATAYHIADDSIGPGLCPAEVGGYVVDLGPEFHKVFATCQGYHVEIETKAGRPRKDATGLGRLHRKGIRPETAISSSVISEADYSIGKGLAAPAKSLALGPAWVGPEGSEMRLADMGSHIDEYRLTVRKAAHDEVVFAVDYHVGLGGLTVIAESYRLSAEGLSYSVRLNDKTLEPCILVPLISTDGDERSDISVEPNGFMVTYRGCQYRVEAHEGVNCELSGDSPLVNRNGLYDTGIVHGSRVRLKLSQDPESPVI